MALHWLGAEKAMRKRAADEAVTEAARKRDAREAAIEAEAQELRLAYYDDNCIHWSKVDAITRKNWLRVARESLTRLGKLDPDE
jgi:hypothetical protein